MKKYLILLSSALLLYKAIKTIRFAKDFNDTDYDGGFIDDRRFP